MKFTALTLSFVLLSSSTLATPTPKSKEDFGQKALYNRIWDDDFSKKNSLPSTKTWKYNEGQTFNTGGSGAENNVIVTYRADISNLLTTDQQSLQITPRRDENKKWTSGKIESVRDFQAQPEKKLLVEAKIKVGDAMSSKSAGIWPRFYTLGSSARADPTTWPRMGEWDILELKNGAESFTPILHCGR